MKPKTTAREELIKIRAEIIQRETKRTIENINDINSKLFEQINKTDKTLARITIKKRSQINKIKHGREAIR